MKIQDPEVLDRGLVCLFVWRLRAQSTLYRSYRAGQFT